MLGDSLELAEVEGRIRAIQHRLNALTIQRAVYLAATVAVLAAALVVAIALRGSATIFGVAFWIAVAAALTAVLYAILRIRRGWLTLQQAAHFADRKAGLDDRLATVLSRGRIESASRLQPVLLDEVRVAVPRWSADVLSPRRVPRRIFALLAALATLAMLSFYARPPAPQPEHEPATTHTEAAAQDVLFQSPTTFFQSPTTFAPASRPSESGDGLAASPRDGEGASHGPSADPVPGHAPGSAARMKGGREPGNGAASDGANGGTSPSGGEQPADAQPDMNERLQKAIQRAIGGSEHPGRTAQLASARPGQREDRNAPASADRTKTDGTTNRPGDSRQTDHRDDAKQRPDGHHVAPDHAAARNGASPASTDTGAEARTGLFTGHAPARAASNGEHALALKLGGLQGVAPSQSEPQRGSPPPLPGEARGIAAPRGDMMLSEQQVPDAPLHKAVVSPEHEVIVRRIFTRDE
jgi:hypothetical protein